MGRYVASLTFIACLVGAPGNYRSPPSCYTVWSDCYNEGRDRFNAYKEMYTCAEAERLWWGPEGPYGDGGEYEQWSNYCRNLEYACIRPKNVAALPVLLHCLEQSDWGVEWTQTTVVLHEDPDIGLSWLTTHEITGTGLWPECYRFDNNKDNDVDLADAGRWFNRWDWNW